MVLTSESLKKVVNQCLPLIYFIVFVVALYLLNFPGRATYVGLDNLSPFWGISPVIAQTNHYGNFFAFGPILYSWWFFVLSAIKVPSFLISQLYVWSYLVVSLYGYFWLTKRLLFSRQEQKNCSIFTLLFPFIFLGSLVPLWVFSTHELMFMSIFMAFPYLLGFLLMDKKPDNRQLFVLLVFVIPAFFTSAVNIGVFLLGLATIAILALLCKPELYTRILLLTGSLLLSFFVVVQLTMFVLGNTHFVGNELATHLTELQNAPESAQVTSDLSSSERQNGAITNVVRFATGWLSLFDEKGNYVFHWAAIYRTNWGIASVQIILVLTAIWYFISKSVVSFRNRMGTTWVIVVLLLSTTGLSLLLAIPLIGTVFRSASTKLWPLIFIPELLAFAWSMQSLTKKIQKENRGLLFIFVAVSIGVLAIITYPWYAGQVYSLSTAVVIPDSYHEFYSSLPETQQIIVLPEPQAVYFRKYSWGYYGSDLVSYMTRATVIDGSSLSVLRITYQERIASLQSCTIVPRQWSNTLVAVEKSENVPYESCLSQNFTIKQVFPEFTVYELRANAK